MTLCKSCQGLNYHNLSVRPYYSKPYILFSNAQDLLLSAKTCSCCALVPAAIRRHSTNSRYPNYPEGVGYWNGEDFEDHLHATKVRITPVEGSPFPASEIEKSVHICGLKIAVDVEGGCTGGELALYAKSGNCLESAKE